MPRLKASSEEIEERKKRAVKWRDFMKDNLFTEKKLAETIGVSRRTVQMVRAGKVTPHKDTLHKFETLVAKYERNK